MSGKSPPYVSPKRDRQWIRHCRRNLHRKPLSASTRVRELPGEQAESLAGSGNRLAHATISPANRYSPAWGEHSRGRPITRASSINHGTSAEKSQGESSPPHDGASTLPPLKLEQKSVGAATSPSTSSTHHWCSCMRGCRSSSTSHDRRRMRSCRPSHVPAADSSSRCNRA